MAGPLARLEGATRALAECRTVDEAKDIMDVAAAATVYARKAKLGIEAQNYAAEIHLRAQRRAGELLAQIERQERKGAGRPREGKLAASRAANSTPLRQVLTAADTTEREGRRWQQVAAIPSPAFEAHLADTKGQGGRLATSKLLKVAQLAVKRDKAAEIRREPPSLPKGPFRVIVVDPPWQYSNRADDTTHRGRNPYPDMSVADIAALPVATLAHGDCVLWLWTTNAFMHEAYHCLEAWGFTPKTILTWDKEKLGMGDWLRNVTEHCIFAARGRPTVTLTNQTTLIRESRREHSRKPEAFYALVEALCPGSKLEMFARCKREGWTSHGAEQGAF